MSGLLSPRVTLGQKAAEKNEGATVREIRNGSLTPARLSSLEPAEPQRKINNYAAT